MSKKAQVYYTVQEASAMLGISEYSIRTKIKNGQLKAKKEGTVPAKGEKLKEGEVRRRYLIARNDLMLLKDELIFRDCMKLDGCLSNDIQGAAEKFYTLKEMIEGGKVTADKIELLKNNAITSFKEAIKTLDAKCNELHKLRIIGKITDEEFGKRIHLVSSQITIIDGYIRELEWHCEMYNVKYATTDMSEQEE